MTYRSSQPTKEKKKLFGFLHQQEQKGHVSPSKLKLYAQMYNLKLKNTGDNWTTIVSPKGTAIAAVHTKGKRITNWMVR